MSDEATKVDDGGQAFPMPYTSVLTAAQGLGMPGMSLRDYFAGMALQGMLANQSINIEKSDLCGDAFDFADRMIERRKR